MGEFPAGGDRRRKSPGRSWAEILIAVSAVFGMIISLVVGLRAFYVNEYRIDVLESTVRETRNDIKDARTDIRDLDRNVQKLLGASNDRERMK